MRVDRGQSVARMTGMLTVLAGCSATTGPGDTVCTAIAVASVVVTIRDAQTGEPLAAHAAGAIRSGTYADSLRPSRTDVTGRLVSLQGGIEQTGDFVVTVRAPAYQLWQRADVRVLRGVCHVMTVELEAQLEPQP
ncbi:MAG: hypothetical protein M3081_12615 [Gemmatimonadota bacterium]|nr:hypothetical protein [Gemmatimonadota bacterium]